MHIHVLCLYKQHLIMKSTFDVSKLSADSVVSPNTTVTTSVNILVAAAGGYPSW